MGERPHYYEDLNKALLRLWGRRSGLQVLDVGCGYASTSQHIAKLGNELVGIEQNPASVAVAKTRIAEVIACDLEDYAGVDAALGERRFDVVLFADVLEHLIAPVAVLRHYQRYLREGGTVIVSLPNFALWSIRLEVLAGWLVYEDSGVLDKTHVRFFTRRTAKAMLRDAGLEPIRATYNPGLLRPFVPLAKRFVLAGANAREDDRRFLVESGPYAFYLRFLYPLEHAVARLWPTLLAWQMVFESRRRA